MLTFFLVLHFIVAVLLVLLILIQKGDEGGALGIGGGGDGAFSPRGQANLLTKITSWLAFLFMLNCIIIANLVTSSDGHRTSFMDKVDSHSS